MRFLKIWFVFLLIMFIAVFATEYNFMSQDGYYIAVLEREMNNGLFEEKEVGRLIVINSKNREIVFDTGKKPFNVTYINGYVLKSSIEWSKKDLICFTRANMGGNTSWKLSAEIYVCNPVTKKIFCAKGFNPVFINDSEIRYQYYVFPLTGQYADMCDFRQKTKIKCKTEKLNI